MSVKVRVVGGPAGTGKVELEINQSLPTSESLVGGILTKLSLPHLDGYTLYRTSVVDKKVKPTNPVDLALSSVQQGFTSGEVIYIRPMDPTERGAAARGRSTATITTVNHPMEPTQPLPQKPQEAPAHGYMVLEGVPLDQTINEIPKKESRQEVRHTEKRRNTIALLPLADFLTRAVLAKGRRTTFAKWRLCAIIRANERQSVAAAFEISELCREKMALAQRVGRDLALESTVATLQRDIITLASALEEAQAKALRTGSERTRTQRDVNALKKILDEKEDTIARLQQQIARLRVQVHRTPREVVCSPPPGGDPRAPRGTHSPSAGPRSLEDPIDQWVTSLRGGSKGGGGKGGSLCTSLATQRSRSGPASTSCSVEACNRHQPRL